MKKKKEFKVRWTEFTEGTLPPGGKKAAQTDDVFLNNLYQVNIKWDFGGLIHLSIKRRNKSPIMDWRHMQRIKNELLGPEYEMVQLFPAESRLVDTVNQYHFFAMPNQEKFPIGMEDGRCVSDLPDSTGARQRQGAGATEEDEKDFARRVELAKEKGVLL